MSHDQGLYSRVLRVQLYELGVLGSPYDHAGHEVPVPHCFWEAGRESLRHKHSYSYTTTAPPRGSQTLPATKHSFPSTTVTGFSEVQH